ncbi:S-layer homology domain-containing protein [Paenibacillus thalictri]|uniref:S-layer homology domain-containing protein n=1 Tax=Paenibacillus thalictri TaxID=2527873 RepID=A0A4Q9DK53_9BACL|nr:S-layer homology domain-containing protein [Paenibacillus thalictri]TBL75061.1 S-layer homology domain-containing protein [Paenibacillus thalictri]
MKKWLAIVFAAAMVTGYMVKPDSVRSAATFADIDHHWSKDSIMKAVQAKYVDGYEDGTFKPDRTVSRAEFIKLAVSALKLPIDSSPSNEWYTPYLNTAVQAGIHRYEDFNQDINGPITRQEMSRIIVRATMKELQKPEVYMDDKAFVFNAAKQGLIQGLNGGELGLGEATTRAQSVTVVDRILRKNAGERLEVDKYAVGNAELLMKKTNMFTVMPEFFGGGAITGWDPDNLFVETPDGNYRGELDQVIAIDLEDPNDPNLKLLPPIEELKWDGLGNSYPVKDFMNSYVLLIKSIVIYNKDEQIYSKNMNYLPVTFVGIGTKNLKAFNKGELNTVAQLLTDSGFLTAYLFPKKGLTTNGEIAIKTYAPARPPHPNYMKTILNVLAPRTY